MRNMLYYLEKNGNKTFEQLPFNEVDSLILCQIAYLNIDKYLDECLKKLLDIITIDNNLVLTEHTVCERKNKILVNHIAHSKRYNDMLVGYVENHLCYEEIKQFYALTYMTKDFMYIAFRGTDLSFCGWNEDFNMAFLEEIPAQREAVKYVDKMYELYKMPLYIGGHSKGGNLAVYSALYSHVDINKYIITVYNFDGPGFNKNIYENEEYVLLKDKILNMTAEEAIVGVLLYYATNQIYVKSFGISLFQHDAYNWIIDGTQFKRIKCNNIQSRWFARAIREFYESSTLEERKKFVEIIFDIMYEQPDASVKEIKNNPFKYLGELNDRKKRLEPQKKEFSQMMFNRFLSSFYKVLKDKIKEMTRKKESN